MLRNLDKLSNNMLKKRKTGVKKRIHNLNKTERTAKREKKRAISELEDIKLELKRREVEGLMPKVKVNWRKIIDEGVKRSS